MTQRRLRSKKHKSRPKISRKAGMPPGSLVHIGRVFPGETTVFLTEYDATSYQHRQVTKEVEAEDLRGPGIKWIEVSGLARVEVIENIGKILNISTLILEDVLNTEHRPKIEIQEGQLFITMKHYSYPEDLALESEQLSFILGKDFVVTFQENPTSVFNPVHERLSSRQSRIRQAGPDFLLYTLLDNVIDRQYAVAELIYDRLEDLEDTLFDNPQKELINKNQEIRKDTTTVRKGLIPLQDGMNRVLKGESQLIKPENLLFLSDIQDHLNQIIDILDTSRELSNEVRETYLSNLSFRMNQVMKLLTIITTIFIPLNFLAGIYGMNFVNMPELGWKWGYFAVLGLMSSITLGMVIFFRRKKWL